VAERQDCPAPVFDDENGVMNRSVQEAQGGILLVSQFTLFASTKKEPSFLRRSARPEIAVPLYQQFTARLAQDLGKPIETGEFGAEMLVSLTNDGPVTIIIDSKARSRSGSGLDPAVRVGGPRVEIEERQEQSHDNAADDHARNTIMMGSSREVIAVTELSTSSS